MYNGQLKNIEVKVLKKIYKNKSLSSSEIEIRNNLKFNQYLNIRDNKYILTDKSIIYLEKLDKERVYRIYVPFAFYLLGVISTHWDEFVNLVLNIFQSIIKFIIHIC